MAQFDPQLLALLGLMPQPAMGMQQIAAAPELPPVPQPAAPVPSQALQPGGVIDRMLNVIDRGGAQSGAVPHEPEPVVPRLVVPRPAPPPMRTPPMAPPVATPPQPAMAPPPGMPPSPMAVPSAIGSGPTTSPPDMGRADMRSGLFHFIQNMMDESNKPVTLPQPQRRLPPNLVAPQGPPDTRLRDFLINFGLGLTQNEGRRPARSIGAAAASGFQAMRQGEAANAAASQRDFQNRMLMERFGFDMENQDADRAFKQAQLNETVKGRQLSAIGHLAGVLSKDEAPPFGASGGVIYDRRTGKPTFVKPNDRAPSEFEVKLRSMGLVPGTEAYADAARRMAMREQLGPTPTQAAHNIEVDAARATLEEMGLDRAEILRRSQKMTETGRENVDHDPYVAKLARLATRRKVAVDDAEFESVWGRVFGSSGGGAGSGTPSSGARAAPAPMPMAKGKLDASRLKTGTVYDDGKGARWRWTGQAFEAAD